MSDAEWVAIRSYAYRYLADFALASLEAAGIPALLKGGEAGIWGPGFAGPSSTGLTLLVPAGHAQEAAELLSEED